MQIATLNLVVHCRGESRRRDLQEASTRRGKGEAAKEEYYGGKAKRRRRFGIWRVIVVVVVGKWLKRCERIVDSGSEWESGGNGFFVGFVGKTEEKRKRVLAKEAVMVEEEGGVCVWLWGQQRGRHSDQRERERGVQVLSST